MPSTNNYRLFGGSPGYIMRNGSIIQTTSPFVFGPFGSPSMGENTPAWRSGANAGFPAAYAAGSVATAIGGWPGGLLALLATPGT